MPFAALLPAVTRHLPVTVVLLFNGCYLLSYDYPSQQLPHCHYEQRARPQEPQPEEILFPQALTLSKLLGELT